MADKCTVDGCPNDARRGRKLCETDIKRKTRGSKKTYQQLSPFKRIVHAAIELGNAEDDKEFERAMHKLEQYALRYARAYLEKRSRHCPQPKQD